MAWGKKPDPAASPGRGGRDKRPCNSCSGTGSVTKWTTDKKGKRISYETRCDNCGGRGET